MPEQFRPNPDASNKSNEPGYDWKLDQPGVRVGDFSKEGLAPSSLEEPVILHESDIMSTEEAVTANEALEEPPVRVGSFGADGLHTSLPEESDPDEIPGASLSR